MVPYGVYHTRFTAQNVSQKFVCLSILVINETLMWLIICTEIWTYCEIIVKFIDAASHKKIRYYKHLILFIVKVILHVYSREIIVLFLNVCFNYYVHVLR